MLGKAARTRKKIRDQAKSLALFDIILQNVDYGVYVADKNGKIVYENNLASTIRDKYVQPNRKYLDITGQVIPKQNLPLAKSLKTQQIQSLILKIDTKPKEKETWFHVRAVPVFNNREKIVYAVNTWKEITSRILEERRREHFIAIGSHELRTPLAGIKALNQVLSKFYYERQYDKARSFFHKIDNKVNVLTKIIQDFIEVEKIRSGKLVFKPEFFDFDEFVESIIQEMNTTYKSHKVAKHGEVGQEIVADRERIYEVMVNLIGNARKYSPESDKIDVYVTNDTHKIMVCIQDYGVGLSKTNLSNIFEPFYRVKDPATEKVHGLGLGLYIAYKIIELHGGKMWVKSKVGHGSKFYFSIPKVIKKVKKTYEF